MADWPSPPVGKIRAYSTAHYGATGANSAIDFDTHDPVWAISGVSHSLGTTTLTGTVQKTAGSSNIVGTGTAFTTELVPGDLITIPGGATETRAVASITDATHLTVDIAPGANASGQTATRKNNTRFVIQTPGLWLLNAGVWFNPTAGGVRFVGVKINAGGTLNQVEVPSAGATDGTAVPFTLPIQLAAADIVQIQIFQSAGGTIGLSVGSRSTWVSLVRLGD